MSRLDTFMQIAFSHKGQHGDWVWSTAPQDRGNPWCAAFVWTCAKLANIGKVLIPYTYSARYMGKLTYEQYGGQRFFGQAYGGSPSFTPRRGDLIFFRWTYSTEPEWWVANHVGIVDNVTGDTVHTIEGNRHGNGNNYISIIDTRSVSKSSKQIAYYVRPAWTPADYAGGSDPEDTTPWDNIIPVTDNPAWNTIEPNTRNDMTIRDVGYITAGMLSTAPSTLPLSIVNYTSGISKLLASTGIVPSYLASGDYSVDALPPVPRAIAQQLVLNGITMGGAIGVLANIQCESEFQSDLVNPITGASGLCQWRNPRLAAMKSFVGSGWKSNVTGQIDFLLNEITNDVLLHKQLYTVLTTCPNSVDGAKNAADKFYEWYTMSSTYTGTEAMHRMSVAEALWAQLQPVSAPVSNKLREFVAYLNEQVAHHSIYVWGAQGQPNSRITRAWIKSMETSETNYNRAVANWQKQVNAGYGPVLRAFDCSGLGVYWLCDLKGILTYDHSANDLYHKCTPITQDQLRTGDFVFRLDKDSGRAVHIGYIVDDARTVIEAKGRDDGVIKHEFVSSRWHACGRPPFWTE